MSSIFLILIAAVVVIAAYLVALYNGLVSLRQKINEALSGIDVQLKRRSDLIPNVVETVKGYAAHEKGVFENVAQARSAMLSAKTVPEKAQADNQFTAAIKTLFAVAEAYPELKANQNFQDLQNQLRDTEDKIAYSRQFYNSNVLTYNTKIATIPANFIAEPMGFKPFEFFKAAEEERGKIDVKF